MPLYLPVRTSPTAQIGICMRCKMKMYRSQLKMDVNVPGLLVCVDCADVLDPYRLPQRQPERISVDRISMDASLTSTCDDCLETDSSQDLTTGTGVILEE